jgi:hypothetical protein
VLPVLLLLLLLLLLVVQLLCQEVQLVEQLLPLQL